MFKKSIAVFLLLTLFIGFAGFSTKKAVAATALKYVALGDSITELGVVPSKYRSYIINDLKNYTFIVNQGVNGSTSTDLNQNLTNNQNLRNEITTANVVTIEIGSNDFFYTRGTYQSGNCGGADNQDCLRSMVTTFKSNWDSIISAVKTLTPSNTAIRALDIYYSVAVVDMLTEPPFSNSFAVLNSYLGQMNQYINTVSPANGIPVAQVHTAYNGVNGDENPIAKGYILSDAVHPTDLGAKVIADQLRVLGYLPLLQPCPDVNGDKKVNVIDLMLIAQRNGARIGSSNYLEKADVNGDGTINAIDLLITSQQTGKICP